MKKIYTGLDAHLGDLVVYTGVIPFIKKQWPDSTICFAMLDKYKQFGEIALRDPLVDEVYYIEYDAKLGHGSKAGREREAEFKKHFDIAHNTSIIQDFNYPERIGFKHVWGSMLKRYGEMMIPPVEVDMNIAETRLIINDQDELLNKLKLEKEKYVIIHPFGNKLTGGTTSLSNEKWQKIAKHVKQRTDLKVVQIGFNIEEKLENVDVFLGVEIHIEELMYVIKHCRVFIDVISGPSWIASTFKRKSIIIASGTSIAGDFRLTDCHYAVPNNPNQIAIQASGHDANEISEEVVIDVFNKIVYRERMNPLWVRA
jgi:ADP-heptose:LPS heptosyltransferase